MHKYLHKFFQNLLISEEWMFVQLGIYIQNYYWVITNSEIQKNGESSLI